MKQLIMAGVCAFMLCACTSEQIVEAHCTIGDLLEIAYESGGATLAQQYIDKLVTEGKLTQEQADLLKRSAQQSYELLQQRLDELKVSDAHVGEVRFVVE